MKIHTLKQLREAHIAHTDTGDFLFVDGTPTIDFYVKGKITKSRAGLFFLDIEGEKFSTHKLSGFDIDEEVICLINSNIKEGKVDFIVSSLKKSQKLN